MSDENAVDYDDDDGHDDEDNKDDDDGDDNEDDDDNATIKWGRIMTASLTAHQRRSHQNVHDGVKLGNQVEICHLLRGH